MSLRPASPTCRLRRRARHAGWPCCWSRVCPRSGQSWHCVNPPSAKLDRQSPREAEVVESPSGSPRSGLFPAKTINDQRKRPRLSITTRPFVFDHQRERRLVLIAVGTDYLATVTRTECLVGQHTDRILEKSDAAVSESEIGPTGMKAAGVDKTRPLWRARRAGSHTATPPRVLFRVGRDDRIEQRKIAFAQRPDFTIVLLHTDRATCRITRACGQRSCRARRRCKTEEPEARRWDWIPTYSQALFR